MNPVAGCCDVGGSTVRLALVTPEGALLARATFSHATPDPDETVTRIAAALKQMARENDAEIVRAGASVPGPLDPFSGIVHYSPNLRWRDYPFARECAVRLGVPVALDDDANCAAVGEHWKGAGWGFEHFVYVIVGTGIGSGMILDGKLYRGAQGFAGELGHTAIALDGPICSCGNRGCLEAFAAGPAIAARMQAAARERAPEFRSARAVIAAARSGDETACRVLEETGQYLGIGLANAVNLLNPLRIAVGGGVALDAGELLLDPARAVVAARALATPAEIVSGALGDDAGLVGAARLAWSWE